MAKPLSVTSFSGSTPRRADHLVPNGHAALALDCRLEHGTLDSWREPRPTMTVPASTKSFYQAFNCCWLGSDRCASFAEGPTELRHVFATQYNDHEYPVRITFDGMCNPEVKRLGLPCPSIAPDVVVAEETHNKNSSPRAYAYQYVDSFGGRSALSPPSQQVIVEDGSTALVSGWDVPATWDIVSVVIYRLTAGYDSPMKEGSNTVDATWMEVATVAAGTTSYTDSAWNFDLIEALVEEDVKPPPADLRGIVWVKSMNCLAGFSGRTVYFSTNTEYHNWLHSYTLDDTVKAIVENNDVLYVATDGAPYIIKAAVQDSGAGDRSVLRLPEALPLVGGGHRSMVPTPSGVVYPSHGGVVALSGNSAPKLITTAYYAAKDWQELHPDTAVMAYHEGKLFAFFRNGAFCMALRDGAGGPTELDMHTELSLRPNEVLTTRSGRFFLRTGEQVTEWNRGDQLMPHRYEGAEVLTGVPLNFGAAQMIMASGRGERWVVYVDDAVALDEEAVRTEDWSLPMWATGQSFRWVLQGTGTVKAVTLAPSTKEL